MANSATVVTEVQRVLKEVLAANASRTVALLVNESGTDIEIYYGALTTHSDTIPGQGPDNKLIVSASPMVQLAISAKCNERALVVRATNIE